MNHVFKIMYLIREFFGDKWFLARVFVPVWVAIFFMDLVTQIFNRFFCIMTPFLLLAMGVFFGLRHIKIMIYENKMAERLPEFERERKVWLTQRLVEQPDFMTHCFECFHFCDYQLSCRLHIPGRRCSIRLPEQKHKTYCFYWNVHDELVLLKDDPRKL